MIYEAKATYTVKQWERRPWHAAPAEACGPKLYRLELFHLYTGDISGESTLQYLISQDEKNELYFVGLERVTGSIAGRMGSFMLQRIAGFEQDRVVERLQVLPNSGTAALRGLRGHATLEHTQHRESYPLLLAYEFDVRDESQR